MKSSIKTRAVALLAILATASIAPRSMAACNAADGKTFSISSVTVNGPSGPITGLLDTDFGIASPILPGGGAALTKGVFAPSPVDGVYSYRVVPAAGTWLAGTYHVSVAVSTPDGEAVTIIKLTVDL